MSEVINQNIEEISPNSHIGTSISFYQELLLGIIPSNFDPGKEISMLKVARDKIAANDDNYALAA